MTVKLSYSTRQERTIALQLTIQGKEHTYLVYPHEDRTREQQMTELLAKASEITADEGQWLTYTVSRIEMVETLVHTTDVTE